MEFDCAGLFNQPVKIRMTNKQTMQEVDICCRLQPVSRDGWLGFQCGSLLFGGPWKEAKLLFSPDSSFSLLFPEWSYEVSPASLEEYEESRDPFSDSEYQTPDIMLEEVEEALGKLGLPTWLESVWNEYLSLVLCQQGGTGHVKTA